MAIKETQRVGVFSESTVSKEIMGFPGNCFPMGIIAQVDLEVFVEKVGDGEEATNKLKEVKPYAIQVKEDAHAIFGKDSEMSKLVDIVTLLGVNKIVCVPVVSSTNSVTKADYKKSLDLLYLEEVVEIVITDSADKDVHLEVRNHCDKARENRRERRAHLGTAAKTIKEWTELAKPLNSGFVTLWGSIPLDIDGKAMDNSVHLAAACGAIDARELDPAMPLHNLQLHNDLFSGLYNKFDDEDYEALYGSGIAACREVNGKIYIDRWVTTYTENDQVNPTVLDDKYQEGTVAKVQNYIDRGLRNHLSLLHPRDKASLEIIQELKTDSTVWLEDKVEKEIIENVNVYKVERQKDKRTRAHVYYSYGVVLPLNTIFLHGKALV